MRRLVHAGGEPPLFSYQTIPSSLKFADRTSVSPSRSATATVIGPKAEASMMRLVQIGGSVPLFSYRATRFAPYSAATMSWSPSPSTSAAIAVGVCRPLVEIGGASLKVPSGAGALTASPRPRLAVIARYPLFGWGMKLSPAATATKPAFGAGTSSCPKSLLPQATTEPSVFTARLWVKWVAMATKPVLGERTGQGPLHPQRRTEPSDFRSML